MKIRSATNQWRKACLTKIDECVYWLLESLFESTTALEWPFEWPVQHSSWDDQQRWERQRFNVKCNLYELFEFFPDCSRSAVWILMPYSNGFSNNHGKTHDYCFSLCLIVYFVDYTLSTDVRTWCKLKCECTMQILFSCYEFQDVCYVHFGILV